MSICQLCQSKAERPAPHAARTREYFDVLIKPLRHVAYRYGYALAQHGSLSFDIDLIACPWRDSCAPAASLVAALRETAQAVIGIAEIRDPDPGPTKKPCGRLAWSIYLVPEPYEGPYIDLSVMPAVCQGE